MKDSKEIRQQQTRIKFSNSSYMEWYAAKEKGLQKNVIEREKSEARRAGLFNFGKELATFGVDIAQFVAEIIVLFTVSDEKVKRSRYDQLMEKYSDLSFFPSYSLIEKLFTNKNYLDCLNTGYENQKRKMSVEEENNKYSR